MVIIPNKFVFLATPRTGSRAVSEALIRKYPDAITDYPSNHHDPAPDDNTLPIYTVIRNPFDQILSWHSHVNPGCGLLEFARTYENVMFFPKHEKYRLNIHANQATEFIPYTGTLSNVADLFDIKLERVGKRREWKVSDREEQDLWRLIDKEFLPDATLWIKRHV